MNRISVLIETSTQLQLSLASNYGFAGITKVHNPVHCSISLVLQLPHLQYPNMLSVVAQHALYFSTLSLEVSHQSLRDKPKKRGPSIRSVPMTSVQQSRESSTFCSSMGHAFFLHSHQRAEDPLMSVVSAMTVKMLKAFMVLLSKYDVDG